MNGELRMVCILNWIISGWKEKKWLFTRFYLHKSDEEVLSPWNGIEVKDFNGAMSFLELNVIFPAYKK